MEPIHLSPEEAVKVHQLIRPNLSLGMHFGTFPMAEEGKDDAPSDLEDAKKNHGVHEEFILLEEGESKDYKK